MNDKQIAAFISVAECGSFSAAARKQYISPQAIIQQIDLLEREVGVQLLGRTHRGVTLTDAGKQFYTGALQISSQIDALLRQVRQTQKQSEQRLRIGLFDSSPIMKTACSTFATKHPDIRQKYIIMQPENWLEDLELLHRGELDIFEHADVPEVHQAGLEFLPLVHASSCVVMLPSHPLAQKSVIHPKDLINQTVGIHDKDCVRGLEEYFREHIPGATLLSERMGPVSTFDICSAGGVFLASEHHVDRYRPLSAVPFACDLTWTFGIVYRSDPSALVKLFIDNAKAYSA